MVLIVPQRGQVAVVVIVFAVLFEILLPSKFGFLYGLSGDTIQKSPPLLLHLEHFALIG
jgi:hypothetical protein